VKRAGSPVSARIAAAPAGDGEPVLLAEQDRRRWDRAAIRRGQAALVQAGRVGRGLGAYGVQAAIAECHAVAPSVEETDWERIALLYEALGRLAPSPVVELNRAVAISVVQGPAAALPVVDDLVAAGSLSGSHLLPSVRGELLSRLGKLDDAQRESELAVRLCGNERERNLLQRKLAALA
jgi:predicted RNA polymerase sigma factor